MKKILAIFLSLALLTVTVLSTGFMTAAAAKTDTWVLFEAKNLEAYNTETKTWCQGSTTGSGLTVMGPYGMYCYAQPSLVNIIKLVVSEDGTLKFDSTNNVGCQNTNPEDNQWINGAVEFALLDKNGKVIFPTDGKPEELATGENIKINLQVEVTAGDEFYFYHRNIGTTQANFQTKLDVFLNGTDINYNNDLCPTDSTKFDTQGAGGWYYMYADPATVEIMHNDPNGVTDFGGDKYVATYTAQPMVKMEEGAYAGYWGSDTTSDQTVLQGSSAFIKNGESVIVRFTAPEDGDFSSAFFGVGLYTIRDEDKPWFHHWWTTGDGEGVDFFIVNQDGELVEPEYNGPAELRTPLGEGSSINVGYFSYPYMKKGDYLDFVLVGVNNPERYPVSFGGDFSFNGVRMDAGGRMFLMNYEEQGHNNLQMLYATDVNVEKASTDAWLEYIRLEKPFTSAPATVEAWVNIPADTPNYRVGTLISDNDNVATDGFTVSVESGGHPRVQYSNGTVDWTVESVDLRTSTWQHIAFTVDAANNTLSFYLDGVLKASTTVTGITAAASDRPAVIGNNLTYAPSTAFSGQVKNLAVFSDVRTALEIAADMTEVDTSADGLMGYYPLNGIYTDKSPAGNHGRVTTVNTGYYEGELEPAEDGEFTIVQMGDQQMISSGFPYVMPSITKWIADNQDKLNIKAVVNVGDYVNQAADKNQWKEAVDATKLLTDAKIPFLFAPGNHEYPDSGVTTRDDQYLKANFPLTSYFKQAAGQDNETTVLYTYPSTEKLTDVSDVTADMNVANVVYHINLGGQDYLFFALEYQPRKAVIDNWANVIMPKLEAEYPNAKTVVFTHSYIDPAGTLGYGESPSFKNDPDECYSTGEMFDEFISLHKSMTMVLSGHVASGVATNTQYGVNGNKITCIMTDFSYDGNGGEGVLMLYRFKSDGTIKVETYSSLREEYYREQYQFDLVLEDKYWLDFDAKPMTENVAASRQWYTTEYDSGQFAHTYANTYAVRDSAAIRTFVAHKDGTLYVGEPSWGGVGGISLADYSAADASVKVAVTDDDGKILWPTDGKPMTVTKGNSHLIKFSIPVETGDKIHFVFYDASSDGVHVVCNAFGYIGAYEGDWFGTNQFTVGNNLSNYDFGVDGSIDPFNTQGPVWYYNYSDSISELTYNPNNTSEGVKSNYELTYSVRGEGGSINVMHNGVLVEPGKITMARGGNALAYAIVNYGYRIKGYYVNGKAVGRQSPYNLVNISEDIDLVIEYEKIIEDVDMTELEQTIAIADAYTPAMLENYTTASVNAFNNALAAAKAITSATTQDEIDDAVAALKDAINGLTEKPKPEDVIVALDFDAKQMTENNAAGSIWSTTDYSPTLLAHTPIKTYAVRDYAAIRTFVAHKSGTLYVGEPSWGGVAGLSLADYSADGDSVKVAVTDDSGRILWPTDSGPLTMTKGNNYLIEFSTPVEKGDKIHFVFYDASSDGVQVVCNAFAYVGSYEGDWFNDAQFTVENNLSNPAVFNTQGPIWYHNYASDISEIKQKDYKNLDALNEQIAAAEGFSQTYLDSCVPETVTALRNALSAAKAITKANTQSEIDAATATLKAAIKGLRRLPISSDAKKVAFTEQLMTFDSNSNVWFAGQDTSCYIIPGINVSSPTTGSGKVAIRKLVLPSSGDVMMKWGGVSIDNTSGLYTGATAEFMIADKDGNIIYPASGGSVTVTEGTSHEIDITVSGLSRGDSLYFITCNPSMAGVPVVISFGVVQNGNVLSNDSGFLYGVNGAQGAKSWYYMFAEDFRALSAGGSGSVNTGGSLPGNTPGTGDSAIPLWPLVTLMVTSTTTLVWLIIKKRKGVW